MKRKDIDDLRKKTGADLQKTAAELKAEIAKLTLEIKINPPKDTNILMKKRNRLAVVLTILKEKEEK